MAVASPDQYLADLNPAQREAVVTTEGPLLVVAGAGSGKTRVLTYRVAHLINACGVKPNEILAITFTNKAAGEMRERLENLLGPVARTIWILTFHAACGRILRREVQRLGYRSNFTIYDQADQVRLTKQVLEELEKDPKRFVPRGIHAQISAAKNQLVTPAEYTERVASFYDQTVAETYDLYQRRLFASNAVDFDDLLMLTVQVLERFPEARERWQKAFRYVLVDEYQDTNHAQYRLLQLLAEKHRNVCAVGDPDQSIYAFRGADIRNILEFERDFGETKTVALEQNYRSTNTILQAANAVIAHNRERKPKNLWSELGEGEPVRALEVEDEHAEARFVAAEIAALVEEGFSGSEVAVFYRTNAQSRVLEDVLVRQGIAYQVIGGPRFYERAEVKDVIGYLQAIDNPYDAVSLQRIANRPRRGIGDTTLARLGVWADTNAGTRAPRQRDHRQVVLADERGLERVVDLRGERVGRADASDVVPARSDLQAGGFQNPQIFLTESISIQVIQRDHSGGSAFALKGNCQRRLQVVQDQRVVGIAAFDRHVPVYDRAYVLRNPSGQPLGNRKGLFVK
jgi:DNA helicase-2/ATP-dependent DNA helicase PcrA